MGVGRTFVVLISDDHQFIFVHIPKTAGSSITQVLEPVSRCGSEFWLTRWLLRAGVRSNLFAPPKYRTYRRHTSARKLQWYLPRRQFQQYYKFAFVRNPWDWLVSYYHFVMGQPNHRRYRQLKSLGSFEHFVEYECSQKKFMQKNFVTDHQGNLIVDFVGRFENLMEDFALVCHKLNITGSLGQRNRSQHRDYRSYYSDRAIELVAQGYAEDIQLFGYTYDGVQCNRKVA